MLGGWHSVRGKGRRGGGGGRDGRRRVNSQGLVENCARRQSEPKQERHLREERASETAAGARSLIRHSASQFVAPSAAGGLMFVSPCVIALAALLQTLHASGSGRAIRLADRRPARSLVSAAPARLGSGRACGKYTHYPSVRVCQLPLWSRPGRRDLCFRLWLWLWLCLSLCVSVPRCVSRATTCLSCDSFRRI